MDALQFGVEAVAKRIDDLLTPLPGGNEVFAKAIFDKTGYKTSGEKLRRARTGQGESIDHALVVAVAETFGVDVRELLLGEAPATPRAGGRVVDSDAIDEWGAARARAVEKLADLLVGDRKVLEDRAAAVLNMSIAARLEAEAATRPPPSLSESQLRELAQVAEMIRLLRLEEAGDGATPSDPAPPPG